MRSPRLNYDVLQHIMEIQASTWTFYLKHSLLPLMQTCRTLYQAGVPLLLRRQIRLSRIESLTSFCLFMLSDKLRFRHLRTLKLSILQFPDEYAMDSILSQLFKHAQQLDHLTIDHSKFLDRYPFTRNMIAELAALKTLILTDSFGIQHHTLRDMLLQHRSNLRSLVIDFSYNEVSAEPIILLEGVAPQLEGLHVTRASFLRNEGPVFPCLKTLSCGERCQVFFCSPLIRAFPNLVSLKLSAEAGRDEDIEIHRSHNRASQESLRWQHLAIFRGSLPALYRLAPRCLLTTLCLQPSFMGFDMRESMLPAVLADCQPINLYLDVWHHFQFSEVSNMLAGTTRLKHLCISIMLREGWGSTPQILFVSVADSFSSHAVLSNHLVSLLRRILSWQRFA